MKSYCLNNDDIVSICKLTSVGLSLNDAMILIENKTNEKIFQDIRKNIKTGSNLNKEFSNYLDSNLKNHFLIFSNYLGFNESLSLSLRLNDEHNKLLKLLVSKLIYPLGLFIISFLGLYIFNNYFFDSLMLTLNSFTSNLGYLYTFKKVIDIFSNVFLIISLLCLMIIMFFINQKNYVFGYFLICKYHKNNIIKRYITNEMIIYFKEMYKEGLKTRQIFDNLRRIKNNRIIANIASQINNRLNLGDSFDTAMDNEYIDKSFRHFVTLMDKSTDVVELLDDYYILNEAYFIGLINRFTRFVQIVSYSIIIFFIFFVYQVILSPLNMLAGI